MGGLITPIGGGGGEGASLPVVSAEVTLGAATDGGATWDFPVTIEVTDEGGASFADGYVNALIYPRLGGDIADGSTVSFADSEGTTTQGATSALTNCQFDATTGNYVGTLSVTKGVYDGTTLVLFCIMNYVADSGFTVSGSIFGVNAVNDTAAVPALDFTIANNTELEAEINGAGHDHGAYGVYDDGTTRRLLRWFAFDSVSGAGRIVPDDVWQQGTLVYIDGYTGTELSTPSGFTTQGLAVNYTGTNLDFDSSGAAATRALNLAIPTGTYSQIYFCQLQRIPSVTNDEGVGALLREGAYMGVAGNRADGLGGQLQSEDPAATTSYIPAGTRLTSRSNDAAFSWVEGWLYDAAANSGRMYMDQVLQSESVGGLDNVAGGQLRIGIADPNGQAQVLSRMLDCWGIV